jgi:hypothetical protein
MLDVVQHEGRVQQYTSQPFVSLNTVVDARNISRSIKRSDDQSIKRWFDSRAV